MLLPEKIWERQPGSFFCISRKKLRDDLPGPVWRDTFFNRTEFDEIAGFIEDHKDYEVYFCPHGFNHQRRIKDNAALPNLLYADLDAVDPHKVGLEPTYAWETSPGRYAGAWLIKDGQYTEDLNQRLSYRLGADHGGWDLTQVLRVPGTLNHKYTPVARVRLLWDNGPEHLMKDVEFFARSHLKHDLTVQELWRRWQGRVSPFVRRELFTDKHVVEGKRSQMIWRLNKELLEAGCNEEERFTLLRPSRWNKFSDRRDGDDQLRREISKASDDIIVGKSGGVDGRAYKMRTYAEIEGKNIEWLWPNYLARSGITIFDGDPGIGKSYVALMVCKAIVDGGSLPGIDKVPKGKVIYFDPENSVEYAMKKRATSNGIVNLSDLYSVEEAFPLDSELFLKQIRDDLVEIRPSLMIFDPLTYFLGGSDSYKAPEVATLLSKMSEMAREFDCSMLMMRHLTKSNKTEALHRGQGSAAFSGVARVVMVAHRMEDDWVGIGQAKTNVSKRFNYVLPFKVDEKADGGVKINGHAVLGNGGASSLIWGDFKAMTANELMSLGSDGERNEGGKKRGELLGLVSDFLLNILENGPVEEGVIERAAREHERRGLFTMKDVIRYRPDLHVRVLKEGLGAKRRTVWSLS